MKKVTIATAAAVALLTAGLSMNLAADSDNAATAAAQQNAKISMIQAINIAEQATGGKSAEAEFELEDGTAIYEVEIAMADGSEVEVTIDAQSGSILSQEVEDEDDEKDDDDKDEMA